MNHSANRRFLSDDVSRLLSVSTNSDIPLSAEPRHRNPTLFSSPAKDSYVLPDVEESGGISDRGISVATENTS